MTKMGLLSCLFFIAQSACASDLMIQKNERGYTFYNDKIDITVPTYMASKSLRSFDAQKVQDVLKNGSHYVTLTECSDGSYAADLKARIKGGGPITAAALYWITKSTIYGAATVATTAAVVTTGGTALGAISGAVGATGGVAIGTFAGTVAGPAAILGGAALGAAEAAGVTAVVLEGAALGTGAVVTGAGGIAGAVACVEAASTAAFAIGMWLPLP